MADNQIDFASQLLDPERQRAQEITAQKVAAARGEGSQIDFAGQLLGGQPLKQARQPTGAISAITGEPITELTATGQQPAGFSTILKTGFADDPEKKIEIFAKGRFPETPIAESRKRYGIVDGDVVYLADDGNIYFEIPQETPRLKKFAAGLPSEIPAIAGGVVGAAVGSVGGPLASAAAAGAGGALGETLTQAIGKVAFGDPISAGDIALEGALGATGEIGGRLIGKGIQRGLTKKGGRLALAAKEDLKTLDKAVIKKAEADAKRYGVELFSPQTTEFPELIDKFKLLSDMPKTANMLRGATKVQQEQVQGAIQQFADEVADVPVTQFTTGKRLSEAAERSIERLKQNRSNLAKPYYEAAFESPVVLDYAPVIGTIDNTMVDLPKNSKSRNVLNRVKKMIASAPTVKAQRSPIRTLDNIKKEIDAMLSGPDSLAIAKTTKKVLTETKDSLTKMADAASPIYAEARKVFAELSPQVTEAEQSIIGNLAKLEGAQVEQASKKLFSAVKSQPEFVEYAKNVIGKNNPDVWNQAVKSFLQDTFESIKTGVNGTFANLGGQFHKKTIGDVKQRKILKAAMGDEGFKNFERFADVLRRTALTAGKESATATRQIALQQMREQGTSGLLRLGEFDITAPFRGLSRKLNEALFGRHQKQLAEALVSPKAAKRLAKVKQLSGDRKKQIREFSTFLSLVAGGEYTKPGLPDMEIPFESLEEEPAK